MTESGNNETLEIDYKSWEGVRSRNEINEISDVLLKANVERSESRYTKPAEDCPEWGVFSIAISNHHPWWSLYNAGPTNDGVQTSIKVEALMNSRPLKYGGADHRDETVLKPNHFLFGQPGWQLTAQVTDDIVLYSWNRWRLNQNLVKLVYRPWREEFLATLKTRRKWREAKDN